METLRVVLVVVVGLVWGSFLNVVIYRLPREKSLVRPPSSLHQVRAADQVVR